MAETYCREKYSKFMEDHVHKKMFGTKPTTLDGRVDRLERENAEILRNIKRLFSLFEDFRVSCRP
jgi:hypothetical protein